MSDKIQKLKEAAVKYHKHKSDESMLNMFCLDNFDERIAAKETLQSIFNLIEEL